jgi:hypothetical protein
MAVSASTAARNSQYGLLNDGGSLRSRGDNIVVDNLLGDTYGTISALGAM